MSTDPYPEVAVDESGIVPNQAARSPEWPKKIRTLTAAELDRLTIDHNGRFYWDGQLVNYEPPESKIKRSGESLDVSSLDELEREAYGRIEREGPENIEGAELDRPMAIRERERDDLRDGEYDAQQEPVSAHSRTLSAEEFAAAAAAVRIPDRVHVQLSRWQTLGAVIVAICMLVGASGIAAYGFVAVHDWGCRIGLISDYCAQGPSERPPARLDIPA